MKKNPTYDFFHFLTQIKLFFSEKKFLEVYTPPMVLAPGIEPHIHPFAVHSTLGPEFSQYYLHTSPEFWMKKLLADEHRFNSIFTLSFSFREEPQSSLHRCQFLMLEWYRANTHYEQIMYDCIDLIHFLARAPKEYPVKIISVNQLFKDILNIEILDYLQVEKIHALLQTSFPDIHLPNKKLLWEDYFFMLFLNKIEPEIRKIPFLVLKEYPYHLSALAKIAPQDARICERFEIYLEGVEIGNCFHELCDLNIQKKRFLHNNKIKKDLYGYQLKAPQMLYEGLEKGLPHPSGIAVGVERLYSLLSQQDFFLSDF